MNEFLQQLINGLAVGGIYALVALGYTMVYGVLKLINFAHGDIFTIGAYLGMTLLVSGGLAGSMTPVLAVGLVVLIVFGLVALLGVALERVATARCARQTALPPWCPPLARPSSSRTRSCSSTARASTSTRKTSFPR